MKAEKLPNNPRSITEQQRKALRESHKELGDLSGIVWNQRTHHFVGGHQRNKVMRIEDCIIELAHHSEEPDDQGTTGQGHIIWQGGKYTYRQVDWDEETERKAMIHANKLGGQFDRVKLAEWDKETLDSAGFEEWEYETNYRTTAQDDTTSAKGGRKQTDELAGYIKGDTKKIELILTPTELIIVKRALNHYEKKYGASREQAAF